MQGGVRLKFALFLASLIVAAAGLTLALLPSLLDTDTLRKQVTARLAVWTGGDVTVSGLTRVSYFPNITLEADNVRIAAPANLPMLRNLRAETMRLELSPWSALFGDADISRLALIRPQMDLAPQAAKGNVTASGILTTLRATPLSRLSLTQAVLRNAEDRADAVENLDLELDFASTGSLSGHGHFSWRDQPLKFSFDSSEPSLQGQTAEAPLNLSVSGPMVDASVSGRLKMADSMQLQGSLELTVPRLRAFGAWMGVAAPEGKGLNAFEASGTFHWAEGRILFDDGAFTLDGNAAQGTLALDMGGRRPGLAGTLALRQFTLAPYLASDEAAPASGETDTFYDPALLQLIDLDLRLSTAEVLSAPLGMGETALSIRVKDGMLAADFSVLAICGGKADGRLQVAADRGRPKLHLTATADGLTAKTCLEALAVTPSPIEGLTTIHADLSATGDTRAEILASLAGEAKLTMTDGSAAIDFTRLFTLAKQGQLRGWEAVQGTPTEFDTLSGQCKLIDGAAHCASLKLATGLADVTGTGRLDLVSGALDGRLRVSNKVAGRLPGVGKLLSALLGDVVVEGVWTEPTFRLPNSDASDASGTYSRFASTKQRF